MNNQNFHPKFVEAMNALSKLSENEKHNSRHGQKLMQQVMFYAPEELKKQFHEKAEEMGLIPSASHVNENGEPVFTSKQIAEQFGVPESEVIEFIENAKSDFPELDLDVKSTFRKQ